MVHLFDLFKSKFGSDITSIADKSYLEEVIKEGVEKAKNLAEHNLKEIRKVVGFF